MTAVVTSVGQIIQDVAETVSSFSYMTPDERHLQDMLEVALLPLAARLDLGLVREHRLGVAGRPDFTIGPVAIEVKVKGPADAVRRQIERYARHPQVDGVVLITTRPVHLQAQGDVDGVPVRVVVLTAGAFA